MERLLKSKDWLFHHWKDVKSNWRNTDDPMKLGLAWSKAFVALLFVLAFVPYSSGGAGWEFKFWTLIKSPPNEIGDTLAGIAGALAFLWIIVTVQLQSRELKAQRQELELARSEYAKMAEAQEKQVEVLEKQREIFEAEQKLRKEKEIDARLEEKLRGLLVEFERSRSFLCIELVNKMNPGHDLHRTHICLLGKFDTANDINATMRSISQDITKALKYLQHFGPDWSFHGEYFFDCSEVILTQISNLDQFSKKASLIAKERFIHSHVCHIEDDLKRIRNLSNWRPSNETPH